MISRISLAVLFSTSLNTFAAADDIIAPVALPRPVFAGGVSVPGVGYYAPVFGGGTTAQESILRGQADVIRAQGEHAVLTAQAARHREEAKDRFLDNEVKRLTVRQERKRLGIAERAHRYEQVQSSRETQMALNRAAREGQAAPLLDAQTEESQAQAKLRVAKQLLEAGQKDLGVAQLQEIASQFTQTFAAREAAGLLQEING